MANIYDVAKEAGVSIATVSYVINEKHNMNAETVEKVNRAVKKLNYKLNRVARSLVVDATNVIGVVVSDISNPFFAPIVRGIEDTVGSKEYIVMVGNSDEDWMKAKRYIETLITHRVDGIILSPTSNFEKLVSELETLNKPIVFVNRSSETFKCDTVESDNMLGAEIAVKHLLEMGHNKICSITGPLSVSTHLNRLDGYKNALRQWSVPIRKEYILTSPDHNEIDFACRSLPSVLAGEDRPTAIFAGSGRIGVSVLQVINEMNLKVPEDISLISFDETEWAPIIDPPLTTVRQKTYSMGQTAAKMLLDRIDAGETVRKPRNIKLVPELIRRKSVCSLN